MGNAVVTRPLTSVPRTSTTALQMSLFDRFFRVAKANMNLVLSSLEDPEKIMNQAVEDMQKDLVKLRKTYSEVMAAQRRMQEQKKQYEATAEDWHQRAQLAIRRNRDDLARQALMRRQVALDEAQAVQQQLNVNGAALDKLYETLQLLDAKILEAKGKKDQMAARAKTAQTTIQINDMLSGVSGKTSMDAFKRMEQKVEALEAAAEASAEMGLLTASLPESNLEREFLALEARSAVDEELLKLKGLLQDNREIKYLSPSSAANIEQELRFMKESVRDPLVQ